MLFRSEALKGHVVRTPTVAAPALSAELGCDLRLKLETQQHTGSFKPRGAFVKIRSLTPAQREAGVIAMSAGNHAQGVAYHAGRLGIPATIVMPSFTPNTKVAHTRGHGATVSAPPPRRASQDAECARLGRISWGWGG